MSEPEFAKQVRDALAKLHDRSALRHHPLRVALSGQSQWPAGSDQGALLQERLSAEIEALKPAPAVERSAKACRSYDILHLRYVEGYEAPEVQRRMALSKSQYYRELETALGLLAERLSQRYGPVALNVSLADKSVPVAAAESHAHRASVPPRTSRRAWRWQVLAGGVLALFVALAVLAATHQASPRAISAKTGDTSLSTAAGGLRQTITLSSYAGSGQQGHINGAAAQARFSSPFGLALAADGTVFVADTGNNRIRAITPAGQVIDVAGSGIDGYADGPAGEAQFSRPSGVAVGPGVTIFVADAGNLRVRAISPAGIVSTLAGSGKAGYADGPTADAAFSFLGPITADSKGNLYTPDRLNNVIREITPAGSVSTFAGNGKRGYVDGAADQAEFYVPTRIAVDGYDNIYIGDTEDSRIRKITPDRMVSTFAGSDVAGFKDGPLADARFSNDIRGLCVDAGGNLYLLDGGNNRIRRITAQGAVSTVFEFSNPGQTTENMKMDSFGNIFLGGRQEHKIYKLGRGSNP